MGDLYRVQFAPPPELQGNRMIPESRYVHQQIYLPFAVLPVEAIGTPNEAKAQRWFGVLLFISGSMEQLLANALDGRAGATVSSATYERAFPHLFHFVQRELQRRGLPAPYEQLKKERPIDHYHRILVPDTIRGEDFLCSHPEHVLTEEPFEIGIERGRIGFTTE